MADTGQSRREALQEARKKLAALPCREYFELAGRPQVAYELRDYREADGRKLARFDLPFLFKAFETGQTPPPRPGSKQALVQKSLTIHQYLDWTVTAEEYNPQTHLDFGGFRVVALIPRNTPNYPPPRAYEEESPKRFKGLGAPRNPLPTILPGGKAISAATIRLGLGWMEIPFVATQEQRRNRGYGRALLESIEEIARALHIPRLLLCSTDDQDTKNTWRSLGFVPTTEADMTAFGIMHVDLLHMDNTVQMHKTVPPPRQWKSVVFRHQHRVQRLYYPAQPQVAAMVPRENGKRSLGGGKLLGKRKLQSIASEEDIKAQHAASEEMEKVRAGSEDGKPPPANSHERES